MTGVQTCALPIYSEDGIDGHYIDADIEIGEEAGEAGGKDGSEEEHSEEGR